MLYTHKIAAGQCFCIEHELRILPDCKLRRPMKIKYRLQRQTEKARSGLHYYSEQHCEEHQFPSALLLPLPGT